MSNTPTQENPVQACSPASGPTQPSRSIQPMSDPSVPKRLCFYKSGDHTFGGHRLVINARTFKTFDALLDALSKKVPLPFGVRTITTPRGTHQVKGLDDLQDGGAYLCSDQKRVKPVNLEEVHRRQVPWNMARGFTAGRRKRQGLQFGSLGRGEDNSGRPAKVPERVAVRTPRRLVVIKNKDPDMKRTIVLQKRTAPTFDALLDYLSQILQFPVLKLYSIDGRRIGGLAALILCSGFLVAAGNEPFRLSNHALQRTSQTVQALFMETGQPSMQRHQAHSQRSSGRCSRNFSLSSEQYIIKQINNSRKGSANSHPRSPKVDPACLKTCGSTTVARQRNACILPQDDDIEKSFRVNQDGSMTVEMKVRLTIKEEEILHWSTTVSRSSLRRRNVCGSVTETSNISPDSNFYVANGPSDLCEDEAKEENQPPATAEEVGFQKVREAKKRFRRAQTPGPHRVMREESFESVKMLTESAIQGNTLGHSSYLERMTEGDTMEGYCKIRHSSSCQLLPKHRETLLEGNNTSFLRSSGVAEVLKIENDGLEVRETVMRIYESHNYLPNADADPSLHGSPPVPQSHQSTASGICSSSTDIDFSLQQPTADSFQRQKEEMLSLSSEPMSPTLQVTNKPSSVSKNEGKKIETKKSSKSRFVERNRKSADNHGGNANARKKSLATTEKEKRGLSPKRVEKSYTNTRGRESETLFRTSTKDQNMNKASARYNGHNVDTPSVRPPMKKNVSDLLKLQKLSGKKTSGKSIPTTDNRLLSSRLDQRNVSKISLNRSHSEIQQYVENWLEEVISNPVVYMVTSDVPEPPQKVLFQIGGDSETEETKETQTHADEQKTPSDTLSATGSCLSVPLRSKEQKPTDVEPAHQQTWPSNESQMDISSPKEKLKSVSQELCSLIQSMRITSDQSRSRLHFSSEVASVFGTSCSALLSFLSVMALRDGLRGESTDSEKASEAMLLLKFLQNISAIEDQDEQRASLIDLHSGVSPKFMKDWMDFQTCKEKLQTESLIPKFQDTRDSVWVQDVDQLIKELPYDLRMEISSALQQPPEEECTVVEPKGDSSESADEKVLQDSDLKQCCDNSSIHVNTNDKNDGSSWTGEMEDQPDQEIGRDRKEPIAGEHQVNEGNIKDTEDHMEESKEAMDEGEMERKGSEEYVEEEAVSKDDDEDDIEEKKEAEGTEVLDEDHNEKLNGDILGPIMDEKKQTEKLEEDEDDSQETFPEEKDRLGCSLEPNPLVEGTTKEATEVLSEDPHNTAHDNMDTPEPTTDEEEDEIQQMEDARVTTSEEESTDKVEKPSCTTREAESEDDLGCWQEPNPEVEGQASLPDIDDEEEGNKGENDAVDIPESTSENVDLQKQEENEDTRETSPEETFMDQVDVAGQTPAEAQSEDDLEIEASPHDEGIEEIEEDEKDNDEIERIVESIVTNPEPTLEKKSEIEQTVEPEEIEEGNFPKEESEEVKSSGTPTEQASEDDLKCFQEPNPEVQVSDEEQEHLPEQTEKLDEDTCPEEESGEEVEKTNLTASETFCTSPQMEKDHFNKEHGTESSLEHERFEENTALENEVEIFPQGQSNNLTHPVEISQDLLDFVNSALQSSSLIFMYDNHGNIRIEQDRTQIGKMKKTLNPTSQRLSSYGSRCLQSPITSDLSDYRPESLESGGYQSQDSVAIISESNEDEGSIKRANLELTTSKISTSHSEGGNSFSGDSKGSKATLSCLRKEDNDPAPKTEQNPEPGNGVLIDQGRWLLKENHLIRNSPPVSEGMYRDLDSTSQDTRNSSEESQNHQINQTTLLEAISSSELEELAKPQPPRCNYFTMPHGSDSDPFLDNDSDQSQSKETNRAKGSGFRVAPVVDTSKTWASKNGSLSSFASVEFKIADRKVYPEGGESSTGVEARGGNSRHQSQDSTDAMSLRCGQYCQIL
ncbi:uncharacterized protein ACBT44_019192 [Syngnathus typhle]